MATAAKKIDPFKVRSKSTSSSSGKLETEKASTSIAKMVDQFNELNTTYKHIEGELKALRNEITEFGKERFAERVKDGAKENFKIAGELSQCTFICQDSSSSFGAEDIDLFSEKYGNELSDKILELDVGSIKFNAEIFTQYQDKIVAALTKALPKDVMENLFIPPAYKTVKNAIDVAVADKDRTANELRELFQDLKLKAYIKG